MTCPYLHCAATGRVTVVTWDADRWTYSCPCGWFTLVKLQAAENEALRTELAAYKTTRTLGGPITGTRVPRPYGSWENVPIAPVVQRDYSGTTEETAT